MPAGYMFNNNNNNNILFIKQSQNIAFLVKKGWFIHISNQPKNTK